jgi:hypothetical protein
MNNTTIYLTLKPSPISEFADVFVKANPQELKQLFIGGLDPDEITGFYLDENIAREIALKSLNH